MALEDFNPFESAEEDLRGIVEGKVRQLSSPALREVSRLADVPLTDLRNCSLKNEAIPINYLPQLYAHFFGNISPDMLNSCGGEYGMGENTL